MSQPGGSGGLGGGGSSSSSKAGASMRSSRMPSVDRDRALVFSKISLSLGVRGRLSGSEFLLILEINI